ncbi:MAG: hypothetical protein V4596_10010 [Bdellovibrionota bacterium]
MKFFEILAKNKTLYVLGGISLLLVVAIGYTKGEYDILDSKFFYLKSEIQPLLISLGEEGRANYIRINYLDYMFMTTYTLFFFGMYFAFFKNLATTLILIPALLLIADFIETSSIHYLLRIFPEIHNGLEYTLMFLTPAKWMLALSTLLVIVNGYFVNLYIKKS